MTPRRRRHEAGRAPGRSQAGPHPLGGSADVFIGRGAVMNLSKPFVRRPMERHLGTIAGVNEITSSSSTGSTRVTLQFDLSRNIDGAAREVQAAINASRVDLPTTLRSNPTYRKANPAAAPVIILALTSKTKTPRQSYDSVSNIVSHRLSQVDGVCDDEIRGGR